MPLAEQTHEVVDAWRGGNAFELAVDQLVMDEAPIGQQLRRAFASSRRFFTLSAGRKSRFVSDLTYAGYVAPGEEVGNRPEQSDDDVTYNEAAREAFTICQDIAPHDPRVREHWPCHGPVPWPDAEFRRVMLALAEGLGVVADRLLRQVALDFGLDDPDVFARLTWSGWHHLRTEHVQRHVAANSLKAAAIDDGLLVIEMRDDANVLTVLPGAVLRFATGQTMPSAPAAAPARYAMTYVHAPNFQSCVRPAASAPGDDCLHYGTHFTNALMHRYPERVTTLRILAEERLAVLNGLREQAARAAIPI